MADEWQLDRWVKVLPRDRPVDVAVRTLKGHLGEVGYWLTKAATKADRDIEYVHQLRVWSRRASAAIDLYRELLPAKRCNWFRKRLKQIRKAANDARDCDVLIARLESETPDKSGKRWLKATRSERAKAQEAIVAIHDQVSHEKRFRRAAKKLVKQPTDSTEADAAAESSFGSWAHAHLRPFVDAFFASLPADKTDLEALHEFRIRGKDLRYAMELLGGAFDSDFRTTMYPVVEELHDRLGEVNDRATALSRLRRHLRKATGSTKSGNWRRRLRDEVEKLEIARGQFWEWFGPERIGELQREFEQRV